MARRVLASVAVVAAALLVGVLLAEGALRLAGISYPDFFRDDPLLGRSLRAGAHGWWTSEGNAWVAINADGLRDREHAPDKPADAIRIAVLGDSYTAAFEVPVEATWWAEMQRRLEGCAALAGRQPEVINFGLGGSGTAQQLLILRERMWKYRPDVVLLAFHTGNDVSDNGRALKGSGRAAYFVHDADGRLVLDPQFVEKHEDLRPGPLDAPRSAVFNNSRVLQLIVQAWRQARLLLREDVAKAAAVPGQEAGLGLKSYTPPADPVWRDAWSVTEDLLRTMAAEVREHGAQFALFTLSTGIQVHPDPAVRQRYAERFGIEDLLYPNRRVEALAAAEGIPALMLAPALRAWSEGNGTCVHGFDDATPCFGHWNANGHRLTGERVADWLCRAVLPSLPPAPGAVAPTDAAPTAAAGGS